MRAATSTAPVEEDRGRCAMMREGPVWGNATLDRSLVEVDVRGHAAAETLDEFIVQVLVVVRDVEAHDPLPRDLLPELLPQPTQMPLLHHEDQVCPAEVAGRDPDPRARL